MFAVMWSPSAFAAEGVASADVEDAVTSEQSVDAYSELEDAQPGAPGRLEERLWLTWGYVPAEGFTPSDELEFSYTPKGKLSNSEFLISQYFEHDDVDNTTAINFGWNQRWVKDGGRKSWVPSIGTLTEYWMRTPGLITLPSMAPGATQGDHIGETLTIAKYLGPGTIYVNGEASLRVFETQICVTEEDVAIQPGDAPDQNGSALPNYDGCDYWAPWTFAVRAGYKLPVVQDRLDVVADYVDETNEFVTQQKSDTYPEPEVHHPYELAELALMVHLGDHWTLSPGIMVGLDGHEETPQYETGLFLLHE